MARVKIADQSMGGLFGQAGILFRGRARAERGGKAAKTCTEKARAYRVEFRIATVLAVGDLFGHRVARSRTAVSRERNQRYDDRRLQRRNADGSVVARAMRRMKPGVGRRDGARRLLVEIEAERPRAELSARRASCARVMPQILRGLLRQASRSFIRIHRVVGGLDPSRRRRVQDDNRAGGAGRLRPGGTRG